MIISQKYIRNSIGGFPFDMHLIISRTDDKNIRLVRTFKGSCIESVYKNIRTDEEVRDFFLKFLGDFMSALRTKT
ncbi:hypothetical protein P9597_10895 [Aneurinibacillus migulanus]|uniref:hypothetical protein n=1 Tax=Aneurinibacillus migulanus TaxID=47500 RepID=UPI002E22683C|nr:hypothetical protein [Aneurinibacillus migulanus]